MSKNFFTFVNTPHDPISISGSDPHDSHSEANLACWYKVQEDHMIVTGSTDANSLTYINTIKDHSLNGGFRDLNRGTSNIPVMADETTADGIRYIEGSVTYSGRPMYLRNAATGSAQHMNGESSTWIKGGTTDQSEATPTSLFVVMKADTDYTNSNRPLTFTFGSHQDGDNDGSDNIYSTFNLGLVVDSDSQGTGWCPMRYGFDSKNSTSRYAYDGPNEGSREHRNSFRCLSLIYSTGSQENWLRSYANGIAGMSLKVSGTHGQQDTSWRPGHHGSIKMVALGGADSTVGGGYSTSATQKYGFAEAFAFEDGVSDIRRQQMESYICDKYDLKLSGTDNLSKMVGGGGGIACLTSSLANPASNISTTTKVARKFVTAHSTRNNVHHETVAGGFVRSSVSGSAFYGITGSSHVSSSLGVSQRMWVRAESIDDSSHAGSHVALVCKAESPFGHQMDNIKGYALKYGTFKDGADTDSLKLRLSSRDARRIADGNSSGFGDEDLNPKTFSLETDKWYQMRLDVLRTGSVAQETYPPRTANVAYYSQAVAGFTAGSGSAWENLFGASSATEGAQTWSIWVKTSDFSSGYPQLMMIGGYSAEEHGMQLHGDNGKIYWSAHYNNSRNLWEWANVFPTAGQDGKWHHILITSKMASTGADCITPELWFDGTKQSLTSNADPSSGHSIREFDDASWDDDGELFIGNNDNADASIYPGYIADAAIWNKILTDAEIAEVYNDGKITPTATSGCASANLVGHWKMNGSGDPLVVQDETSNDNDATAFGTVTSVSTSDLSALKYPATSDGVDTIKVFARSDGSKDWELLTTKTIEHTANNFRYWKDDTGFDTDKVRYPTGIHNGYYIAMSSSTGQKLSTTYYIDNYSIQTSGSNTIGN